MRSAYRRPCGASISQGNRAGTRRVNANWKREMKVLESPRLPRFVPTSSTRSFVRSFASALHTRHQRRRCRVTIDVVAPRRKNDDRCSFRECRRTTTLVDECAESRNELSGWNGNGDCLVSLCMLMRLLTLFARLWPVVHSKAGCWEEWSISK